VNSSCNEILEPCGFGGAIDINSTF